VGECVTLSLAEEPRDLARIGLRKNYSTIVAAGSDRLINEVGAGLIESGAVLGAIPIEENSAFHTILGTKNYIDACDILPQRKVLTIDCGLINSSKIFITEIIVKPKRELSLSESGLIIVNFDGDFQAETKLCEICVSNVGAGEKDTEKIRKFLADDHLDVFIPDQIKTNRGLFSRLFGGKQEVEKIAGGGSIFHPKRISIESRKKLIAQLSDKIIERGNMVIESYPASLKIIIKRERPQTEEEENNE
jgi:diacylglycerol kinase family enzyme